MSWPVTNQPQMRPKILTGSPKKNAACLSFSNMKFGNRPGVVSRCQTRKTATSSPACQTRSAFIARSARAASCRELLAIAGQHLLAKHRPDRPVQLDEARRGPHFRNVARTRKVDRELADRMRCRPGREADDAVA